MRYFCATGTLARGSVGWSSSSLAWTDDGLPQCAVDIMDTVRCISLG